MSDKSVGGKGKPPDKRDVVSSKPAKENGSKETPNLTEKSAMGESSEPKLERAKSVDKKVDPKPAPKQNGTKSGGNGRGRREEERKPFPGRPVRKPDSKPSNLSPSKRESERRGQDSGKSFSDESRLSKLMRRLIRETERDRRLATVKQLKDMLYTTEGGKAAVKVADDMLAALQDLMFERGLKETKLELAGCIGMIGCFMGTDAQRFFQWLFGQINTIIEDDIKSLFLIALQEALKFDEKKQVTAEFMPMVMGNVQTLLENADTPELLTAVINVIMQLAKTYPHVFSSHFRDTVDILVGWHIDSTQKDSLIDFTSQALISFHQFWITDISFTITLLGQFLEDMEAYAEDLAIVMNQSPHDDIPEPEEVIKMTALFRVFITVIKSLGEEFSVGKGRQFALDYMLEVFERTVHSADSAVKSYYSESMLFTANECVCLLLVAIQNHIMATSETLLRFMLDQIFTHSHLSYKFVVSLLQTLKKVLEQFGTQLPVPFMSQLLAPGSVLQTYRFAHNEEVLSQLMSVFHYIMGLKSVPLLEEAYKFVLGDMQQAYNILLEESGEGEDVIIVDPNPYFEVDYSVKEAETVCIFNLCALAEIGNTKNNVIGMWALSPSIFDLFSLHLDPLDDVIARNFPAVQYAIFHSLFSHCTRHGNFVSSSTLLTQNTALEGSVLANVNPTTSGNFSRILKLLAQILTQDSTGYDSKCLGLKWASDIISNLQTNLHVFTTKEFILLIQALHQTGYDRDLHTALNVNSCLQNIYKNSGSYPVSLVKGCVRLCMFRLSENSKTVRDAYFALLILLPLNVTASQNNGLYMLEEEDLVFPAEEMAGLRSTWQARRTHIGRLPFGTFHSHNFRQVMGFILNSATSRNFENMKWLESMFHSSQRTGSKNEWRNADTLLLQRQIEGNSALQWFWVTWEAAQFCVLARLRTPLGKPQETFTTIEGVIKSFASEASGPTDEDEEQHKGAKESSDEFQTHLRVRLLLQFIEQLEKLLYNAYEGCAVAIATPPKTVRTFFRTNKGTCLEWLTRIRMCVMTVALHNGMPAMVVRQASETLREMREANNTQGPEFEQVILVLVQALCDLRDPEALLGLYSWCKDVLGKKMTWVKAAVEKAYGRYESAAKEYRNTVKSMLHLNEGQDKPDSPRDFGEGAGTKKITGILSKPGVEQPSGPPAPPLPTAKINFAINEVTDSYIRLNDWGAVLEWQETLNQYRSDTSVSFPSSAYNASMDLCFVKALMSFDDADFPDVHELLELVPGASLSDMCKTTFDLSLWGPKDKVQYSQRQFLRVATAMQEQKITNHKADLIKCLRHAETLSETVLRIEALNWPILLSHDTVTEFTLAAVLRKQLEDKRSKTVLLPLSERLSLDANNHDVATVLQSMRLVKLQQAFSADKKTELNNQLLQLQLSAVSLARKQHNFEMAEHFLMKQTGTLLRVHLENGRYVSPDSLQAALSSLRAANGGISQLEIIKMEREGSKLLHSMGQHRDAVDILSNSVVGYICADVRASARDKAEMSMCSDLCSRSLLTLVKWLQADHKSLSNLAGQLTVTGQGDVGASSVVARNLKLLLDMEAKGVDRKLGLVDDSAAGTRIGDNPILSESDRVVGRMLHLSTIESQTLPKAWFSLASWCYKWGRKAVDNASHGSVELFPDEKSQILALLPKGTSPEETETVLGILSQIHTSMVSEEDISDQDQSQYDDGTETTRKQLLSSCLPLQIAADDCIERLLEVWRGVVHRVYNYYQLSAKSYFTFLQLNGVVDREKSNEDCNVIATLRLLRLLVKHAWELRNVLECGLADTPTGPWKGIIPQLFSRLSHPEAYVRQSISDLLCRVAEDAPHLTVYPAVVGSSTSKMDDKDRNETGLLNNYLSFDGEDGEQADPASQEEEDEDADMEDESSNTMLQNCLAAIVEKLAIHNPKMISDVKQLIHELRRITLLWDELWLGTLNQQHQDVVRRLQQLENEIKKVNSNNSLSKEERSAIIREKHKTVLKPTVYTMERLVEITSQPAETPHERWFQETYGDLINTALEKLKNPPNPNHPHASWHPFKQIHVSLQQKAQKRSSLLLRMDEISPKLESLRNTVIAMPGIGTIGQVVTIQSVSNTVQILPTKTKPKKLVFKGSDGKRYPYLFKGLEDLHLDERIMQFLSIVNNMFASANKGSHQLYRARHYSVTPLGPRSGLIQWVDGATPLFGLYKRWQQREAMAQLLKQQANSSERGSTNQPNIPRPSEIYYNKLTPALKEKGIKDLETRKDWPLSVLRKVLEELISETPKDLLSRELWCSSTGPSEWWYITQTYARSTAVMSMIGYIIGLGDRHLDNVLVDLSTGEVVHIDYNVCFEKGKGLRVPEKVPFRLTQNLEIALGITGVEGTFRIASEHVIKTMRKGRETLLTLLEAFVYDPLVDWTTGNEGGYTGAFYGGGLSTLTSAADSRQSKKEMERDITVSMFSIRVAEMKMSWQLNRDEMMSVLPKIQEQLQVWTTQAGEFSESQGTQDNLQEVKALVTEALADTNHQLYTLSDRFKEYSIIKSTQDIVHKMVEEKINEFSNWQKMHKHVTQSIQGPGFQRMCAEIAKNLNLAAPSFAAATEFLQGAGQGQIVAQCEQVETEMTTNLQLQRSNLHRAIDVIHTHGTIVSQFGSTFADQNRTSRYLHWLQELVCDFTTERCAETIHQYHELYGEPTFPQSKVNLVLATELKIQNIISEVNSRLIKLIERRSLEAAEASLLELQVHDSKGSIEAFIAENGLTGVSSLTGVIATALCALNKRYLQMEGAAAGAGDRLMDLTSRDGDWFLDELCSMSGNVVQFLDTLKTTTQIQEQAEFCVLHKALLATHHVYVALQELNINFRTIILPEALKAIQSQEPSVCSALEDLETILAEGGLSMDIVVGKLETLHRNAVMGMETENQEIVTLVQRMQQKFMTLLQGPDQESMEMRPGQMLLMGFNGLFTRLEDEFANLLECMDSIQVPEIWRKVDAVREAKAMQLSSFTGSTRSLLANLFFVKRLQVMQEFFHMCTQFAAAVQGLDGGNCFDDEQLSKPIKRFIAEYVRKQVIGFPSQVLGYILCVTINTLGLNVTAEIELKDVGAESKVPLEDLCKKSVDSCLRTSQFQHIHLTQASTLTSSQDATWRRHDLTRRLDTNIDLLKASLTRAQLQLTRLQWVHEDLFLQSGRQHNQMVMPNRVTIMSEIKKCMQALMTQETTLATGQSHYTQLEASISQRLKWAAGANPSLNLVMQQFEEASNLRREVIEEEMKHTQEVVGLCQGILHLEALRTRTSEAVTSDTNFLALINKCNESCILTSSANNSVTDLEALLVDTVGLVDEQETNMAWMKSAMKEINSQNKDLDKKVLKLKTDMDEAKDKIKTEVTTIRNLLSTHHKLMSDIRAILKSLAKQEEADMGDHINPGGIREYLNLYKNFSENFTTALKMVISDDISRDGIVEADSIIEALKDQIPLIYDKLVQLAPPLMSDGEQAEDHGQATFASAVKKPCASSEEPSLPRRPSGIGRDLLTGTPPSSTTPQAGVQRMSTPSAKKTEKITRDPRTGKAIQERNSYAVGVWRRVKMKLDGRDPDPNKRLSAAEQVDYVIKDATHLDNLAVLYEGWTPWV